MITQILYFADPNHLANRDLLNFFYFKRVKKRILNNHHVLFNSDAGKQKLFQL